MFIFFWTRKFLCQQNYYKKVGACRQDQVLNKLRLVNIDQQIPNAFNEQTSHT